MKNYEINSRTLAIVPVGENLTNVLEEDNEFMINMNSMKIIEKSCEFLEVLIGKKNRNKGFNRY